MNSIYRIAVAAFGLSFLVWTQVEGNFRNVVLLGVSGALLGGWTIWRRWIAKRIATRIQFAVAMTASGLAAGLATPMLILLGMAIKQGLHGHGPEYTTAQVATVTQSILWSGLVGLLFGMAAGLLLPFSAANTHRPR
ncbi:MAG: hypothetical protein M9918_00430 [Anaerolineae bacterium]|nr:hypothetical protein [Anaerolineae bacterium]